MSVAIEVQRPQDGLQYRETVCPDGVRVGLPSGKFLQRLARSGRGKHAQHDANDHAGYHRS